MEQAGMAIAQTASDLQTRLKEGLDVKAWSAEFPWITLGVAAAAGFFVGSAVTPSREQTFQERLKSLFPEVTAAPETTASASPADASAAAKKPGALSSLSAHLFDALKTAVVSTISSAVTAKTHQEAAGNGNGRHSGEPSQDPTAP